MFNYMGDPIDDVDEALQRFFKGKIENQEEN